MAQVDFSHAVLDVYSTNKPLSTQRLGMENKSIYDTSGNIISTNDTIKKLVDTPNRRTYLYTGEFNAGGTTACLGIGGTKYWQITNVSFASGDTYSFAVEINISGNAGGE